MVPHQPFLRSFSLVLLAVLLVHAGVAALYLAKPELFYYRAWEYFFAWANKTDRDDSVWQGVETSDLGRRFMFMYQEPRETFVSTDADGFRTVPSGLGAHRILVQGRSNVFGSGVSDDETFPWRLAELSGVATFNGAHGQLLSTLSRPGLEQVALVVDVIHERHLANLKDVRRLYKLRHRELQPYAPVARQNQDAFSVMTRPLLRPIWWLPDLIARDWRRLMRDFQEYRVHGSRPRLALPLVSDDSAPEAIAAMVEERCRIVESLGYHYLAIVLPARHTVYRPPGADPEILNRGRGIAERVATVGCPLLDLFDVFQMPAAADYYFSYDTHWSAPGQALAAKLTVEEISRRWPELLASGSTPAQAAQ